MPGGSDLVTRSADVPTPGASGLPTGVSLIPVPVVAAFLASAGVPLYIHLPQFSAATGMGLGTIGLMLLGLRVLDFVQDPALGVLVDRFPRRRPQLAALSFAGMGAGFLAAFTLQPGPAGLAAALALVFTAYSLGTILFYGQGAEMLSRRGPADHYRLAGLREAGALSGIVIAAMLPQLLGGVTDPVQGYARFGVVIAAAALGTWYVSRTFWVPTAGVRRGERTILPLLRAGGGRLLTIALLNALPVAVTSTLFVFFVRDRLELPGSEGLFLVIFFVSAGVTAPGWSWLASRFGARRVLVPAMLLAIASFVGAAGLPPGGFWGFVAVVLGSGAALGADMVILPALFATVMSRNGLPAGAAFGLWSFAGKMSLALAAAAVLPALQIAGYTPGGDNSALALSTLNTAYAIVPCILKLPAILLVARLPKEVDA